MHQAIKEHDNRIQDTQYENVGLQGKIQAKYHETAALQRYYVSHLSNEDNNNCMTIIAKKDETA